MTKEVLNAKRFLVTDVGYGVPTSKEGYLDLVRALVDKVQREHRESDATTWQLSEKKGRPGEW